ncbi:metallophosphoesterase family protein [Planctomycetota bacterium]
MRKKLELYAGLLLVLVMMTSCALMPSRAPSEKARTNTTQFYFAQVTDTHFGKKENELHTQEAVNAINSLPMNIEFVAVTGDLTAEKLEDESIVSNCLAVLNGLKPPVHYLPGNHDILRKKHDATMQIYTNHFGELISQQEYHGVVCLFVYTEPLAQSFSVPGYKPLKELETRLKQADGKPVIVFHHSPSVDDFYGNQMHEGWKKDVREQWVALLNKYQVKAVIAGHFHRDEHHWLGNVPLYVSSSIADTWGRQATYRIYEYKNGKIGYRTQYIR